MYFYKIVNLVSASGACSYKGLNADLFIAGSQVYPHNLQENNMCLVASTEDVFASGDLSKVSEEEYVTLKQEILSKYPAPQPSKEELNEQRIAELEMAMASILGGAL